MYSDDGEEIFS